jgi:hypothetical protein
MTPDAAQIAWRQAIPKRLDDRARDALSADLGLTFYRVEEPGIHTIAHRFLADDGDSLLRIVQGSEQDQAIELLAFAGEISSERARELELAVSEALARLTSPRREREPSLSAVEPLGKQLGARLTALADRLSNASVLLPGRLQPIEVLGEGSQVQMGPIELVLGEDAHRLLAPDLQQHVIFDGSSLLVWLSGTWVVTEPSRLVLYVVGPADEVLSVETDLQPGRNRLRLELAWPHDAPPTELLVAMMPRG